MLTMRMFYFRILLFLIPLMDECIVNKQTLDEYEFVDKRQYKPDCQLDRIQLYQ